MSTLHVMMRISGSAGYTSISMVVSLQCICNVKVNLLPASLPHLVLLRHLVEDEPAVLGGGEGGDHQPLVPVVHNFGFALALLNSGVSDPDPFGSLYFAFGRIRIQNY